ncbi:MAG: hypothetical protein WCK48_00425 [bacterium]
MTNIYLRMLLFIIVLVCVIILPWWLSTLILVGLTVYFSFYLEVVFFGFLFDVLYEGNFVFPYKGLILSLIFLLVVMTVRKRIRI